MVDAGTTLYPFLSSPAPGSRPSDTLRPRKTLTAWAAQCRYLIALLDTKVSSRSYEFTKRTVDLAGSALLLLLLLPVFTVIALAIKLQDGGPILFWQKRVGKWGRVFDFPKFRSMVIDAEAHQHQLSRRNHHGECVTFKIKQDPRITAVGRILRKLSLDELPQLWCVLKGDMSLVGPRPPLPSEVERYSLADRCRLEITPGLTCLWQVKGRADIPFPEQVKFDVEYIESRSLFLDFRLLLATVPAVLSGRGAY